MDLQLVFGLVLMGGSALFVVGLLYMLFFRFHEWNHPGMARAVGFAILGFIAMAGAALADIGWLTAVGIILMISAVVSFLAGD